MREETRTEGEDKQRLFYKEIELVISMEERERDRVRERGQTDSW